MSSGVQACVADFCCCCPYTGCFPYVLACSRTSSHVLAYPRMCSRRVSELAGGDKLELTPGDAESRLAHGGVETELPEVGDVPELDGGVETELPELVGEGAEPEPDGGV